MKKVLVLIIALLLQTPVFATDAEVHDSLLTNPDIIPQTPTEPLKGEVEFNDDGTVYLDKTIERPTLNIKPPNTILPVYTPTISDSRLRSRSALANASKLTGEEYYISPIFNTLQEQAGNFSYGTYYGASMDSAQMTYSTSWFTRYDGKKYAITSTYSTDSQSINGAYQSMLGISPEIKLTKSMLF